MKTYLINMHLLVPRSRSSAKVMVKYKGYISQKMTVSGAFVFHKHNLFPQCFLLLSRREINILSTFNLAPANASNLVTSKILSLGKGLNRTLHSILSKPLAVLPHDHCRNNCQLRDRKYSGCSNCHQASRRNCLGWRLNPPVLKFSILLTDLHGLCKEFTLYQTTAF